MLIKPGGSMKRMLNGGSGSIDQRFTGYIATE